MNLLYLILCKFTTILATRQANTIDFFQVKIIFEDFAVDLRSFFIINPVFLFTSLMIAH